ncbi:MAG TPA: carboxypeptidase regulatory-like domain-containing protein [Acidobacteriaceae bacterium]
MNSYSTKKHSFRKAGATGILALATFILGSVTIPTPAAFAQATPTSGAIQGTISDQSGAAVPGAQVTITNTSTSTSRTVTTDSAGFYNSGSLNAGQYAISVAAPGFQKLESSIGVNVNVVSGGNFKLPVGQSSTTVTVQAGALQVNTEQSTVQNTLSTAQIDTLPVNGRNFLDLAQLEPGVQLQSGETFDPTKAGYSALSFSGLAGRTTRIQLDGQDITDETVGTTIFNVSQGSVDQVQIARSTQDVTGDITSTGSVQAATRSGTNAFHGNLFYDFQDHSVGFAKERAVDTPFQRNQFGGSVGGPIIKDKLFFFGNAERIKQDTGTVSTVGSQFAGILAQFPFVPSPFRETYSTARLDWAGWHGIHFFARANYEVNSAVSAFGKGYSIYANRDNTPGIAGGADFSTAHTTHSVRVSYEKFHNFIADAVSPTSTYYGVPGIEFYFPAQGLYSGPNYLAPQQTYQSDKQFRYDGSWIKGQHNIRFGAGFNRILGGGLANFFGIAPRVRIDSSTQLGPDPSNPLDYGAFRVVLGNGQGFFTEKPGFGYPAGGQGDWRTFAYVADSWKIRPDFTLNYGIRWSRDTGRSDSDLAPIPCSAVDVSLAGYNPCSSPSDRLLDQFGAGLGARVRQPNFDLGPQLGFAYSPGGTGKTVIRGGIGVFFENSVFNNVLFDRPFKLAEGRFNASKTLCSGYGIYSFTLPGTNTVVDSYNGVSIQDICNKETIAQSGPAFAALQQEYQQATAKSPTSANGDFVGNTLAVPTAAGYAAYAPDFKTAYATQINIGVQREMWHGSVLSVDYLHSVTNHIQQAIDTNHIGDARYFDPAAAAGAIQATLASCGVGSIDAAIAACPGLYPDGGGATIADFANNGLDSEVQFNGGYPSPGSLAFPGINPKVGQGWFQFPSGRAGYDALQVNFRQQARNPLPGIADSNFEASYSLSREVNTTTPDRITGGSDAFFTPQAWDYNQPTRFIGPGELDRTHILSFGGSAHLKYGPRLGLIGHIYSSPATNLVMDTTTAGSSGQIFQTDYTGDGSIGDVFPGTNPGAMMRQVSNHNIGNLINRYNSTMANRLTPAGQTVVNSGLISAQQMQRLGGVMQPVGLVTGQGQTLRNYPFRTLDANFTWPVKLKWISESATLEPAVSIFNVANFGNYTLNNYDPELLNSPGATDFNYPNAPMPYLAKDANRVTRGSGTFDAGDARSMQFELKFTF